MFERINLKFPHFSFRIFLFSLFGLVILIFVFEGGYYLLQRGKITEASLIRLSSTNSEKTGIIKVPEDLWLNSDQRLFGVKGRVEKTDKDTFSLMANEQRFNFKIGNDAKFFDVVCKEFTSKYGFSSCLMGVDSPKINVGDELGTTFFVDSKGSLVVISITNFSNPNRPKE